ncbi:MAG: methyltransferase [Armatimonadota bacterium]|nr:methyltransferase [Armatimonadota bacterium]
MEEESAYERLSDFALGFQSSRIFLTAVELDIFTHVEPGARTAAEVSSSAGTSLRGTEILLNALAGLGLLEKSAARYSNTPLTSRFLVAGIPDYAGVGFRHTANLWRLWSSLNDVVKTGKPQRPPLSEEEAKDSTESFIMLMHERARFRAPKVAEALELTSTNAVLDIGGGPGTHSIAFAEENPHLCAVIFDLPEVVPIARRIVLEAGMQDRITVKPGDYYVDDFGEGYDLAFLSAIIHSNSPDGNKHIFRKAFDALVAGGRIAVVDFIMNTDKTTPEYGAIFAVNMLVATDEGNCYSEREIREWFAETGFINPSIKHEIDEDICMMIAIKP